MKFVKIGDTYYNSVVLGSVFEKEDEEGTKYFAEVLGGQKIELTEEEYNEIKAINSDSDNTDAQE